MSTLSDLENQRTSLLNQLMSVENQIRALDPDATYITIAGVQLPPLSIDSGKSTISTNVNAGRNTNAVVVGQKIGRDQSKLECNWSYLPANEWKRILDIFERSFFNQVRYYDMQKGTFITRTMYVGDRSARPFKLNGLKEPTGYLECQLNLIDTGRGS